LSSAQPLDFGAQPLDFGFGDETRASASRRAASTS
jgi:hypothetical protein